MPTIEGYEMIVYYKDNKFEPYIHPEIIRPNLIFQKLEVYGSSRLVEKIELRRTE